MQRRAGIYVRISSDPEGTRLGVTRQLEDCQRKAESLDWAVVDIYEDNDKSASSGAPRPEYQRLLQDLEGRSIDAVVVWDLDRLTRRPIEIEQFIDIADRRHVALASVGGDIDLATDNGRLYARIKGAVARAEIERRSARLKRANLQRAERGSPAIGGRRAFGYARDGVTVIAEEAAEVRQAAEGLLAGVSIHALTRALNGRGVTTTTGGRWRTTEVRRMLANPRYAGLCTYHREVIGKGNWPAILDEETHIAIKAVLSSPDRQRRGRPRRFLLSGIARCGVCGGKIYGATDARRGGPVYRCESRAHVCRRAEDIEAFIEQVIVTRLAREDAVELFHQGGADDDGPALREEEGRLRARLDGLAEAFAAAEIDRAQLRAGTERVRSELDRVTHRLGQIVRVPALTQLVTADDVQAVWNGIDDIDRKREIVRALIEVSLHSPGRGARSFKPNTVKIRWRTGRPTK